MSRKPPKPHVSIWFLFVSRSTVATFCSITEHGLKIIFYYTCVSFQECNNRYQKEVFAPQSKHTAPPLWNKPHSSNTLYVSLAQQIQVGKQERM